MGGNMDWSVTTGPMFYILQFQCKDRSVTFVFPKITWTEYVTHWASSLLSSPAQSGNRYEADHSYLSSAENRERTYISTQPYDFPTPFIFILMVSQQLQP